LVNPALKLFEIEKISLVSGGQLEKEFAHDEFIFRALKQIFFSPSQDEMIKFFNKNKNKIDKIRRLFSSRPNYLGGGADGVAFDIGGGRILKIFRDTLSYNKAVEAYQRLHKQPELAKTEAMIYDINSGSLMENVYYYIMEQMKTIMSFALPARAALLKITKGIVGHLNDFKYQLKPIKSVIDDPSKHQEIKEKVHLIARKISDKIMAEHIREINDIEFAEYKTEDGDTVDIGLKANWLPIFVEEIIIKYLTSRTDLHMGNLGITGQGELRYFDPAYSGWTSKINV
jgi:hypothetical protein